MNDAAGAGQMDRMRVLVVDDDALLRRSLHLRAERLVQAADQALYQAKGAGRDRLVAV